MRYRTFGTVDWNASALGFGCMRLPILDNDPGGIDEGEATRMVRYAIDKGVNYIDTAYPYHRGTSEPFLGRALQDGYRERVRLATKMPCWRVKAREDFDTYLNEQLERLKTKYIDFYLLHQLDKETWEKMVELNAPDWLDTAIAEGKIMHAGFSFHDTYALFCEIVDSHDWTFCQIQYNYMDEEYQAGTKGLNYAHQKGLAVVVMEPVRGGQLASPPPQVKKLWETAPLKRSPAEWALQWVWDHPEVSVVLSGMSTMAQVQENVESASRSRPHALTEPELTLIGKVRAAYRELVPIPCTSCQYCLPCPNGVKIPDIFEIYNEAIMYNAEKAGQRQYQFLKEEWMADKCAQCGECEKKCPQSIDIRNALAKAHEMLKPR